MSEEKKLEETQEEVVEVKEAVETEEPAKKSESEKVEEKLRKQIEKKQEQRDKMGGTARIIEYLKTEHKWENYVFILVAALTLVLGGLMLTGFLTPNDNIPFIKDNAFLFSVGLTVVGLGGLIYALYPFFKPAFPEFKKITWLSLPKFVGNAIRVFIFLIVFALLFELYESFITSILYRILG